MVHHLKDGLYGMRAQGRALRQRHADRRGSRHRRRRRMAGDPAQHRRGDDPGALPRAADREALRSRRSSTAAPWASTSSRPISPSKDAANGPRRSPASRPHRIVSLAREMAATRTTVNIDWSLQRAHHGEQPFWALVTLACMLGQIGLPGGGFGAATGRPTSMGSDALRFSGPTLPQGTNAVQRLHPGRALHRHAAAIPAARFAYNGARASPIPTSAWSTGRAAIRSITTRTSTACAAPGASPRPSSSTSSSGRRPPRWPTSCCPPPPASSATTSATAAREPYLIAMKKAREPIGEARDDYCDLLRASPGAWAPARSTPKAATPWQWLAHLYEEAREKSAKSGVAFPAFEEFWEAGIAEAKGKERAPVMLARFRADPAKQPAQDAVGQDRDLLREDRLVRLRRLPRPRGVAGADRMAGLEDGRALSAAHAVGPADRQAAQPARPQPACHARPRSRAASRSPSIPTMRRRAASPTATWCACSTTAAPASPPRALSDRIRRGVVRLSTGAWFDPADSGSNRPLEKHGNPNALTLDIGASQAQPGLHRPDLPGRDRALRRAGAAGDRAPAAGDHRTVEQQPLPAAGVALS